jgi:HTH-type transcriptional regulator/antitoxin HigA
MGGRGRVSEVMTGKRELSEEMIRRLHKELGIPLRSLLG